MMWFNGRLTRLRERKDINHPSPLFCGWGTQCEGGRKRGGEELKYIWEEEKEGEDGWPVSSKLQGYEADVKGLQNVYMCACVCEPVPTSVIRHRGLVAVPLLLEDDVAKLKHWRNHLQHGYKYKNSEKTELLSLHITFASLELSNWQTWCGFMGLEGLGEYLD